jgi:hypothetical protein
MKNIVDVGYTAMELCCEDCPKAKREKCEANEDDHMYSVMACLRKKMGKK